MDEVKTRDREDQNEIEITEKLRCPTEACCVLSTKNEREVHEISETCDNATNTSARNPKNPSNHGRRSNNH